MSARSSLYLHAQEIYNAILASYTDTEGLLKFNLALSIDKLAQKYGEDLVSQVLVEG